MEAQTKQLMEATSALKNEEKELRLTLRSGTTRVPMHELKASVTALEQQKAELTERLAVLESGVLQPVDPEECLKVDAEWKKWQKAVGTRKKVHRDLWDFVVGLCEDAGGKPAEVREQLAIES